MIVAMTGDAVNDAAALKQADIGVAMGSGSEVTKQAGRMILTDDNFGTLVNAVEIGRRVYEKIVSYVRYQMTQLLALVVLFIAATIFDVNEGVALTPLMVIYLLVFVTASGVVIIALDPGDPDVMHRPPRDPKLPITNRTAVILWIVYGAVLAAAAFVPLVAGPDDPSTSHPTVSLTMTFVVMGLGTVFNALDQPPRSGERARTADPRRRRCGPRPDRADLPRHATPQPATRPAHHLAHRAAVARRDRSRVGAPRGDRDRQVDPSAARTRTHHARRRASGRARACVDRTADHVRRRSTWPSTTAITARRITRTVAVPGEPRRSRR